jgi:hypothetical protein
MPGPAPPPPPPPPQAASGRSAARRSERAIGIRLEIVARTPYRDEVVRRWDDFRPVVNPLADLHERERR